MNGSTRADGGVTRLSYPSSPWRPAFRRLHGLAWRSLISVGIGSLLAGCLVAEPPSPSNPEQTPPMINNTFPLVTQITPVTGTSYEFSVGFRSEDRGDPVFGLLYRNSSLEGEEFLSLDFERPSTFADTTRRLAISYKVPSRAELSGCQQVTMVVTHSQNLTDDQPREPISRADVALASWWVHVNPDPDRPDDFGTCPKPLTR